MDKRMTTPNGVYTYYVDLGGQSSRSTINYQILQGHEDIKNPNDRNRFSKFSPDSLNIRAASNDCGLCHEPRTRLSPPGQFWCMLALHVVFKTIRPLLWRHC